MFLMFSFYNVLSMRKERCWGLTEISEVSLVFDAVYI